MEPTKIKKKAGGARPGAGRPKGGTNSLTAARLLDTILSQTGQPYEELLVADWLKARETNDALAHKYHSIITNKVMTNLAAIEVTDSDDQVLARQTAFAEAIAKIAGISVNLGSAESDK